MGVRWQCQSKNSNKCKDETVQKKVLELLYSKFSQLRKKQEAIQIYKKQTFYFLLVQVMRPCSVSLTYNTVESKENQVITTY